MKRIFSMIMAGCLLVAGSSSVAMAKVPDVKVKINGAVQTFDVPPVIKNGRVLVPLRKIFESLGAKVSWDPKTRTVTAAKDLNGKIVLQIGARIAYVTSSSMGESKEHPVGLDVPAEIRNGRTLVPIRFVSESFNSKVDWVEKDRLVMINTFQPQPAAFIKDKGLEQTIRGTLKKPAGPLTKEDLKALDGLMITANTIDLTGLEYATNLKHLFLNANQVTRLEVLGSLSSVEELSIDNVKTKDIRFLERMSGLQNLRLSVVPVEDITPIGKLANLTTLSINQAPVKDIRPLAGLTQLRELDLEQNQIEGLSALKDLTKLERLTIYKNPVKDSTPLQNLTALKHLSLSDTEISDGASLAGLQKLEELALNKANLKNIDFVTNLTQLSLLNVSGNKIQSIPSLAKLDHLQTLFLDENPVKDISSLAGHPTLEKLYLGSTMVTDITALSTLSSLKEVGLFQSAIDWKNDMEASRTRQQLEQKGVNVRL